MKKWICVLMVCCIALSLMGCAKEHENENRNAVAQGNPTEINREPTNLTLDEGEVRLVYAKGKILAVVFHGPYRDIGMGFWNKESNEMEYDLFLGYGDMNPGWTMAVTYEMSDAYSIDQLGLHVSDYDAPRNADGTYANRVFPDLGEPLTDQELKDIGFDFLDGRCCVVSQGRGTYGSRNFGILFGISWFCDNYDQEAEKIDIDNIDDRFAFFTGDGTPLNEAYEGYSLELKNYDDSSWQVLLYTEGDKNEEKHKEMADQLVEGKPYMTYTCEDGTTQTFPLF